MTLAELQRAPPPAPLRRHGRRSRRTPASDQTLAEKLVPTEFPSTPVQDERLKRQGSTSR